MNDLDIKGLLESASRTTPREHDPVAAVLRRHQQARRRTAAFATTGLLAACTAAALIVTGPGGDAASRTRLAPPAGSATSAPAPAPAPPPQWEPPGVEVSERGINGVEVTAEGYEAKVGPSSSWTCLAPGAITVVAAPMTSGSAGCDAPSGGPGALIKPEDVRQWTGGAPARPGVQLIDGVPAYVSGPPSGGSTDERVASVSVPSRGVRVELAGNEAQVRALLDSITIQPRPEQQQAPARASGNPVAGAVMTEASGEWVSQSRDPILLARLQEVVDTAPLVHGEPDCVLTPGQQAQIDLLTTPDYEHNADHTPTQRYLREYTYLAVDLTGGCDLLFSSTGAILRPDPATFGPLVQQLRDSKDFNDGR
ncbi:hypothetical protein CLV92_1224 [Kineococcus xinjiangensis]|uniref:Uncharacterized protein n=1 Tax=Kineococcus xinjiangensis TaxID=512762 RepID=A0A2S6IC49_9ACTN|nr:hypothetical protein [Kineococcus xinjiangensis]PPK90829.1 hypothetical protein CLV92_1224 [Kineococcus xinjiangensis]